MKSLRNVLAAVAVLAASLGVNAQIMIGHRGSMWGVENTRAAFVNGMLEGFNGLECDIRVTKDNRFIISHDENLKRLTQDSVVVCKRTYEYLKQLPLSQISRDGRYYEGHLCSLDEYLDICKEYKAIPIIEIKWCTTIHSNNSNPDNFCYDGIPALMELIKYKGFENKAIILTSMRGVLVEIRKSYPKAQLQCLTGDKWEHLVDFCVNNSMDIDVRRDVVDAENLVKTFHENGLRVNVWCVDNEEQYKRFSKLGFDYITTNCYMPPKEEKEEE